MCGICGYVWSDAKRPAEPDLLRRMLDPSPPKYARLIVGYSGWDAGQLDEELRSSSWLMKSMVGRRCRPRQGSDSKPSWDERSLSMYTCRTVESSQPLKRKS